MNTGITLETSLVRKWRSVTVLALGIWALRISAVPLFPAGKPVLRGEDLRVITDPGQQSEAREMLPRYFRAEGEKATKVRLARLKSIRTPADFAKWQEENRKNFLDLIGGLPDERTPLNARVVGQIDREGYVVRKVIFESLPEFYVTANLYVPTVGKPPFPAVLSPCGHSRNGKAYDVYQRLFIGLAKRGYVVLSYDPLGQGERLQYWDFLSGRRRFEFNQHGMAGIQEYLLGQNLARYFIWDGIRALDYLTGLPEVDASRVGVTGNSGGGTLTTYISMLDMRVKVASVVTFITTLPKKIENRSNDSESDPEQDIAGLLAAGIDHTEFLGMIAPRPVMIGAATRDFFPIEGTRQTFREVQGLYRMLGLPERLQMVEFDHRHMYSQPLRESTYAWFDRWLKGTMNEAHEPAILTEKDEALECTPTGQVLTSLGGKTVYDFNHAEAERLMRRLEARRNEPAFEPELPAKIRIRLGAQSGSRAASSRGEKIEKPGVEKLGEAQTDGLIVEKYLLTSEPGIVVPIRVIFSRDHLPRLPAVVYLRDRTGDSDSPALFEGLARRGRMVAVADVRGFGETTSQRPLPESHVDYFGPRDGMDADFTYASFFLGRTLLGMRVDDARSVIDFMLAREDVDPAHIAVAGRGWAGLIALFAVADDARVSSVAVEGIPFSFAEIAVAELYNQPVSLMLTGVLQDFDLPDVFALLALRQLLVLNPQDVMLRKIDGEKARQTVQSIRRSRDRSGAERRFEVEVVPIDSEAEKTFVNWISEH